MVFENVQCNPKERKKNVILFIMETEMFLSKKVEALCIDVG